jgi:hypothetical protein
MGNKKKGRPTNYCKIIADKICLRLMQGETLRSICREEDYPPESTVRQWALDNREGFYAHYARARDIGIDSIVDEMIDIADSNEFDTKLINGNEVPNTEWITRSRLRVDTRKWYVSKMAPKRYGEKIEPPSAEELSIEEDYSEVLKTDEDAPESPVI